jgi:hypothetical protein
MQDKKIIHWWVENIIIGLDLCPFAKIPYEQGKINLITAAEDNLSQVQNKTWQELESLLTTNMSSTLVFFPKLAINFEDFYDFVCELQDELEENNLAEHFQLVCFHPEFYFEGTHKTDRGNYVNRSPYPMIHILMNHEITVVTKENPSLGQEISLRNQKKLAAMNEHEFEKIFGPLFDLRGR